MSHPPRPLGPRCVAELLGTFLLVFFGCGVVHAAVLFGAQSGLWQVAVVWSLAVAVAVFTVGAVSGGHINPAVSVALAVWGRFPARDVLPYVASQLAGAALAAALLFTLFQSFLAEHERARGVERGRPGSEVTAMCYGEYYPSPGGVSADANLTTASAVVAALEEQRGRFGVVPAALAELVGTAILALVVFALTDPRNAAAPEAKLAPAFIGLTVGLLISVIAPLTQACFNPARDFGPRAAAYLAGWGEVAFPGPNGLGCLLVYLAAPVAGAVIGGGVYDWLLAPRQAAPMDTGEGLADTEGQ